MRRRTTSLLALLALLFSAALAASAQQQYTVTVHVTGFRNATGQLGAAVFSSAAGWPEDIAKSVTHAHVPIHNGEATIEFKLPAGTYSIAVLHDENQNQKLDRNLFGVPKEGFGFSNNIKAAFTAPAWQKCSFVLDREKRLEITLQYK